MERMYKEYTYKIHDKDNVFKKTLLNSKLKTGGVEFTRTINQGYWAVTLSYDTLHSANDLALFDVVYIYYWAVLVYRGYISLYTEIVKDSKEYIDIRIDGMQSILKHCLYTYTSNETFTRTADPATMLAEILTVVNTNRGRTIFDTTITSYWTNLVIDFDYDTGLTALNKIMSNIEHYIDFLPDGTIVFQAIDETTADHKLTFEKHISEFSRTTDSLTMSNFVYVKHTAWIESSQDATSQTTYGLLQSIVRSTAINDDPTGVIRADTEIANKKDPNEQTILAVNSQYDLETINIGDTVRIMNKSNESATNFRSIKKIIYRENVATLYLSDYDSIEKSLSLLSQ